MAKIRERRKAKKAESAKEIKNSGAIIFANPDKLRPLDRIKRRKGFRPLILFKPMLRKRLLAKNVKLRDDKDVVELGYKFKKHIQDNKPYILADDRFLTLKKNFESENFVDDAVSVAKDFTPIIKQIVQGIINFFKKIKEREKAGNATAEEVKELKEIESTENEERTKKESKEDELSKMLNFKNLGILLGLSVLAFFGYKALSKK